MLHLTFVFSSSSAALTCSSSSATEVNWKCKFENQLFESKQINLFILQGMIIFLHWYISRIDWQWFPILHLVEQCRAWRSKSSNTTLFHRTSGFFICDIWRPLLRIKGSISKVHNPTPRLRDLLHPKSTTLPPPVLINNWCGSVSTPTSSLRVILQQST